MHSGGIGGLDKGGERCGFKACVAKVLFENRIPAVDEHQMIRQIPRVWRESYKSESILPEIAWTVCVVCVWADARAAVDLRRMCNSIEPGRTS